MAGFRRYESILAECIDAMQFGSSVEDCLERYPRQAEKLRPALLLAQKVSKTPQAALRPGAQDIGWKRVEKRLAELQTGQKPTFIPSAIRDSGSLNLGWLKPMAITAVAVFAFGGVGGGLVLASQSAMPSSPLYRVKLAGEDVRVWFISDDTHKANVLLDQSQQRMEEINDTVKDGGAVPENALAAIETRNRRAFDILQAQPENTELRARVTAQAKTEEDRLLALSQEVPDSALGRYSEVVADLHNTQLYNGSGAAVAAIQPEELTGGVLTISGQLQNTSGDQWSVGGVEVRIDSQTLSTDSAQPQPGETATLLVARSSNGRLHALNVTNIVAGTAPSSYVSGAVEDITDDAIKVAGQWIPISSDTLRTAPISRGDKVQITLNNGTNGVTAGTIDRANTSDSNTQTITFDGTIEGDVSRSTRWTVSGQQFDITKNTTFDASAGLAVGDGARVEIQAQSVDGHAQAQRVTVLNSKATADTATIVATFQGYVQTGVWDLSGLAITASPDIPDDADPPDGALIIVSAKRVDGELQAIAYTVIEAKDSPPLVEVEGLIKEIHGSRWTLDIGQVRVSSTTKLTGKAQSGERVIVWGARGDDGVIDGTTALVLDDTPIVTIDEGPTPTPVPDVSGAAP
ncbi:MAG: DUF5666 domain-containing protein [Chloroflexota bacterium]